jgi:REP element-mobilizing transposase RayT
MMPRAARMKSESGIYHVMLRGINRQTIFEDDEDCEKYLHCLRECKEVSGFVLFAYCLMGNHIHLLIKEAKEPLEQIFKRIGARYVFWYNWKYKRSGHLFQDRYKSEPIKDDKQFIAVLRYIYQNPVRANICTRPEDYRWSSCRYLGQSNPLIDAGEINEIASTDQLRKLINEVTDERFIDLTNETRLTDAEAAKLLKEFSGLEHLNDFMKLQPAKQESDIKTLHEKGCSIRQIVRITGLTKAVVERMLA